MACEPVAGGGSFMGAKYEKFRAFVRRYYRGATGIGFALAKAFGKEGAHVMIAEPRQHRLEEAVELLREVGIKAVW